MSLWFKGEWQQLQASYTVLGGGELDTQVAKKGYETVSAAALIGSCFFSSAFEALFDRLR